MNADELRDLIRIVEESEIDELEIRRWGRTVRIVKNARGDIASPMPVSTGTLPQTPAVNGPARTEPEEAETGESETGDAGESEHHRITSPMVGTFYRAPAPEAPPFVEVGDRVRQGQTLCILEAMKLMNELESEVGGVVRDILVANGEPVEYGQPLFEIETA